MTLRLALLIVALFCALVLVAIDFGWIEPDEPHHIGWLGMSLAAFYGSLLVKK